MRPALGSAQGLQKLGLGVWHETVTVFPPTGPGLVLHAADHAVAFVV